MGMSIEELVRANFAAFNDNDVEAAMAMVAANAVSVDMPSGEVLHGPEGVGTYQRNWHSAFSDARTEITAVIVDGNRAAIEFIGRGTHDGTFVTPMGDLPPTGRTVEVSFAAIWEFENEKVTASRTYYDAATFARQLGMMS
jgi:steroid delta-isomerase-like uncharacterized protein